MNEQPTPQKVNLDLRALPYGLRLIVQHLGAERTITVLTEQQGQVFYIPPTPQSQHDVVKVFGLPLVTEWAKTLGGSSYQVPMLHKVLMQLRNQTICTELANNTSTIQALVKRFGITRQQITSIYQQHLAQQNQLGLGF